MATLMTDVALLPEALAQVPDEALLGMMTRHDVQALSALYDRYGRLVYSLALHITDDLKTAERVTEAVFQHIWTAAAAIRAGYTSGHTWIIVLTRQHAIKALRSLYKATAEPSAAVTASGVYVPHCKGECFAMEETTVEGKVVTSLEEIVWEALTLMSCDQVTAVAKLTDLSEYAALTALSGLLARGIIQRSGDHEHIRFVLQ